MRAFKLIEDLTGSTLSGLLLGSTISAGGSPQTNRVEVLRNFDLERRKNLAKDLAKIT
jgi:aromatic ring hydroxylase